MQDEPALYAVRSLLAPSRSEARELSRRLEDLGARVVEGGTGVETVPALLLGDGISDELIFAVTECAAAGRRRVVVVLSDPGRPEDRWRVLESGASDILAVAGTVAEQVAARLERWRAVDRLLDSPEVRGTVVGTSPAWRAALARVVEVARFTSSALLVTGETGTGKELVARLFHHLDARPRKQDLVVLDCTTVVPTLSGSEFFGHEKGAFTGAVGAREGAFAAANGGTLFLDEVGELPPDLQTELLRVVQEGTYKRVGSNSWRHTDFRLVCATNQDLDAAMLGHAFRRDLYYRIAGNVVHLPPLAARRDDVIPLFRHFLGALVSEPVSLDDAVVRWLQERDYPGNVRDLRQLAARIAARHVGPGPVTPGDVPEDERPCTRDEPRDARASDHGRLLEVAVGAALEERRTLKQIKEDAADTAVRLAMARCGTLRDAARRLDVTERALQLRRAARVTEVQQPSSSSRG